MASTGGVHGLGEPAMEGMIPVKDAFWSMPPEDLLERLQSSTQGLSEETALLRLEQFGPNVLKKSEKATPLRLFLGQFKSPIILILLFATGVSALVQDFADALIILLIVLGSAGLSFYQEYTASSATEKLRARVRINVTVLRKGQERSIPAEDVVPGDVVLLSAGSLVPADGVLLRARDFYVNQAVLTGETFPVEHTPGMVPPEAGIPERTNCVFMGTNVRSGTAEALVVRTGVSTIFGQISKRLTLRPPETEFERGIRRFGHLLSEVMLVLVLAVFAVNVFFHRPVIDSLLFSIALAVGITPDLLPAIISVSLSKGAQGMARRGVIVRRLESIENFGSMDVLCTDKTGTLTEGVVHLDAALDFNGQPSVELHRYAYLNAHFETGLANPLDEAILAYSEVEVGGISKVDEVPYDFVRKRLTVIIMEKGQRLLITKGALDNVLAVCAQVREAGDRALLDEARRTSVQERYQNWSGQGFRVLGVATKEVPAQPAYTRDDEHGLTFVGFLLFSDRPKPDAGEIIGDLAEMGVELRIISGDNSLAVVHTAESVGLEVRGVITGAELQDMGDDALWQAVDQANLFAEVDPNQKERIILALKKTGHVVGYMGDGINDAPALHAADVAISAEGAVDVAREAADFVLLERDLVVLREGIAQGRKTFANTLKYVFITTSANFGNMFSMAGASLLISFLPLLPKQILLVNSLTDFPAMAISSDNVDRDLVETPQRWNVGFIRDFMIVFGLVSSVFDYLTFGVLLVLLRATTDVFRTGWFLESVVTELLILLVIRTRRRFWRSKPGKYLVVGAVAVGATTLILPYSPLGPLLGFVPLPLSLLLVLGAIAVFYVLASEAVKKVFYGHRSA
jgi:Mg2+-importing ATPase